MGLTLRWDITKKCNLKCKHCSAYEDMSEPLNLELPFQKKLLILDKISKEKVSLLKIYGGEPFLIDDLSKFIDEAYIRNIPVGITTNGTICINETLSEQIILGKLRYITFSLDSINDEINSILRPKNTTNIVLQNIINIINIRDNNNLPIKIAINCVLNNINYLTIESILDFCLKHKIDKISFSCLVPRGRAKNLKHLIPKPESLIKAAEIIAKFYTDKLYNSSLTIEPFFVPAIVADYVKTIKKLDFPIVSYFCRASTENGYIDEKGNLYPCESLANYFMVNNNNLIENSFRDIWNSPTFNSIFQKIESGDNFTSKLCNTCKYRNNGCYPCMNWSIKPQICEFLRKEYPSLFEINNENTKM